MKAKAGRYQIMIGLTLAFGGFVAGCSVTLLNMSWWLTAVAMAAIMAPTMGLGMALFLVGSWRSWRAHSTLWRQRAAEYDALGAPARLVGAVMPWSGAENELFDRLVVHFPAYLFEQDLGEMQLIAAPGHYPGVRICEFSDHTKDSSDAALHWQAVVLETDPAFRGWWAVGVLPGWIDERLRPRDRPSIPDLTGAIAGMGGQGLLVIREGLAAWLPARVLSPTEAIAAAERLSAAAEELAAQPS